MGECIDFYRSDLWDRAGGPADCLPADDVFHVFSPGTGCQLVRSPGRQPTFGGGNDPASTTSMAWTPQRLLAGLGGLVSGRRGEPQRLAGPGVFPFATLVEFLVVAAGTVMDGASLTLAAVDIPISASAQLSIRARFIAMRRIRDYFGIPYPPNLVTRTIRSASPTPVRLHPRNAGRCRVPLKPDRDQAWQDFAGWQVNYDVVLLALCALTMAPTAPWSSDRAAAGELPPVFPPPIRSVRSTKI